MIRRRSCTWMSFTSSRSSSLACSGFSSATIASSWSARPARAAPSGGVCVLCGEAGGEVGFSFAERFEAVTVAADAVLEEVGCKPAVFEGLEVAFQLVLDAHDLGTR